MPSPAQYYFTFRDVQPNHEGVMPEGGRQVFSSMDVSQADLHEGVRVKAQGYGTGMITEILDIDGGATLTKVTFDNGDEVECVVLSGSAPAGCCLVAAWLLPDRCLVAA